MSIVSSYYPGRIRLRSAVLKDKDISEAVISMLNGKTALKNVQCNNNTGSLLIEYVPDKIDIEKLKTFIPYAKKIQMKILFYNAKKDKPVILAFLDEIKPLVDSVL